MLWGLPFQQDPEVTQVTSGEKNRQEKCERKKMMKNKLGQLDSRGNMQGLEKYKYTASLKSGG